MKNKKAKNTNSNVVKTVDVPSDVVMSAEQIDAELDELAAVPPKRRVWEIDFLRGLMILFVVWDHFMYDVFCVGKNYNTELFIWLNDLAKSYYSGVLRRVTHDAFVTMFVFTSGVSCSFSQSNGKRAIKMTVFACLLTAATYALSAIIGENLTMNFNVIHTIALSVLLWTAIEFCRGKCVKNWQKNIFGVVMTAVIVASIVVGSCAKAQPWTSESKVWFFLVPHTGADFNRFTGGDYSPFLPNFGWFLVGAFLGKIVYRERKSLFPSVNEKWVCPVTFCGRYSLWVYVGSQIVMFGLIYLFSVVWGLL